MGGTAKNESKRGAGEGAGNGRRKEGRKSRIVRLLGE
jgi:hypothetical protein